MKWRQFLENNRLCANFGARWFSSFATARSGISLVSFGRLRSDVPRQELSLSVFLANFQFSSAMVNFVDNLDPAIADEPALKKPRLNADAQVHELKVSFKKLVKEAFAPKRGSDYAAGADLHATEGCTIPPNGKAVVPTGLSIALPPGTYGRIAPRSGLAFVHQIDVGAGVISEDFRGEVKVLLFNFGTKPFEVNPGDRIAQLVVQEISSTTAIPEARTEAVEVRLEGENAKMPEKSALGFTIFSAADATIAPKTMVPLSTGVHIALPPGYYGRGATLNNHVVESHLKVYAGVIDEDYRGEVRILLFNYGDSAFEVKAGDAVAQVLCEKVASCDYMEAEELDAPVAVEQAVERAIGFESKSEDVKVPSYQSSHAAGAEVFAAEDFVVPAGSQKVVKIAAKFTVKPGHYGRLATPTDLAVNSFIDVAGVQECDSEDISVTVFNFGEQEMAVKKGDCIALMIAERIAEVNLLKMDHLSDTKRGTAGFGSTGVSVSSSGDAGSVASK